MRKTHRAHIHQSSYREALLEHLFAGALLRALWQAGPVPAEVMKPQVDDAGYDLVIEANRVIRHIQLNIRRRFRFSPALASP